MNILVVAAHGLYADYGASFVHSQAKEYVKAGHRVRAIVPVAAGKRGIRFFQPPADFFSVAHQRALPDKLVLLARFEFC